MTQAWIDAVLRSCIGGTAAIVAVWLLTRLWRNLPAGARALLWLFAFARLFFGLFFTVGLPVLAPLRAQEVQASFANAAVSFSYGPPPPTGIEWVAVLFGAWLFGVLAFVVFGMVAHSRIRRLARHADLVEGLTERYGVEVRAHQDVPVPLVFGLFRPRVLLPSWHLSHLSAPEVEMVIEHELAHVRRWDSLSSLFVFVNHALFFFNPAVWLARREWQHAREAACDEAAIHCTACDPGDYAAMLVNVSSGRPTLAALSAAPTFRTLKRRINDMKTPRTISNSGKVLLPLLLALSAMCSVPVALTHQDTQKGPDVKIKVRPANAQEIRVSKEIPLILTDPEGNEIQVTVKAADSQVLEVVQQNPLIIRDSGGREYWLSVSPLDSHEVSLVQGSPTIGEAIAGHLSETEAPQGWVRPATPEASLSVPGKVSARAPVFLKGSVVGPARISGKVQVGGFGGRAPGAVISGKGVGAVEPAAVAGVLGGTAPRVATGGRGQSLGSSASAGGIAQRVGPGAAAGGIAQRVGPGTAAGGIAPKAGVAQAGGAVAVGGFGGRMTKAEVAGGQLGAVEVGGTLATPARWREMPPISAPPTSVTIVLKGTAKEGDSGLDSIVTTRLSGVDVNTFFEQLSHVTGVKIKTTGVRSALRLDATMESATLRDVLDTVTKTCVLSWSLMPDGSIEIKPFRK